MTLQIRKYLTEMGYSIKEPESKVSKEELAAENKIKQEFNRINLSEREIEIIQLICKEMTCKEIAERLFISVRTVERHRDNIIKKIGAKNTVGIVKFVIENNLYKKSL